MPIFLAILTAMDLICSFHVKNWSIWTPRNFADDTFGIGKLFREMVISVSGINFLWEQKGYN